MMKEDELRNHTICNLCDKKLMEEGNPFFGILKIRRYLLDLRNLRELHGLTMMFGMNAQLASVMGPNRELAKEMDTIELTICGDCLYSDKWSLNYIWATAMELSEKEAEQETES